jgi:hypothetical protein
LEVAQQIEDDASRATALANIASTLAEAGDCEQAVKVARQIEIADERASALSEFALTLATEPISGTVEIHLGVRCDRQMKNAFTPEERELARQIVEAHKVTE